MSGRLRVLAVRYRAGRWAAAVAAGLLAATTVGNAVGDAETARSAWGTPVEVVLTRTALQVGDVVTSDTVELVPAPSRLVPPGAITELPLGQRVTTEIGPGEILVDHRLTSQPGSAASIVLPEGTRGVHLDRADVTGDAGDVVELHALISGHRLTEAVIVHADESSVTVAVPSGAVTAVVDAISQGGFISVLVP